MITEAMLIWFLVAGILLAVILIKGAGHHIHTPGQRQHRRHRPIVEICKERELFYLPGDDDNDEYTDSDDI